MAIAIRADVNEVTSGIKDGKAWEGKITPGFGGKAAIAVLEVAPLSNERMDALRVAIRHEGMFTPRPRYEASLGVRETAADGATSNHSVDKAVGSTYLDAMKALRDKFSPEGELYRFVDNAINKYVGK